MKPMMKLVRLKHVSIRMLVASLVAVSATQLSFSRQGLSLQAAVAAPQSSTRGDFFVHPKLRGRVDFWKDIFAKYGKHYSVIHHRDFPQAVFDVVDMSVEGKLLSEVQFKKYKKKTVGKHEKLVSAALKRLGKGALAKSPLEKRIVSELKFLPGGASKYSDIVKNKLIRSQTGIKERYREAVKRSGRYIKEMEQIFRSEGLPIELTRMPFIESSFDYSARSSVGASGIWQFMPRTGRSYMTINSAVDERLDPITATKAAARYLKFAYGKLGSWPLAATSYNHGVYGVARKVKKFGSSNIVEIIEHPKERVFGFASTNFYPELLAAVEIFDARERYFPGVVLERPKSFEIYKVENSVYMRSIMKHLAVDEERLKELNYALLSRVWQNRIPIPAGYSLRLPRGGLKKLAGVKFKSHSSHSISLADGEVLYTVRRGDTLSAIARKHSTYISVIKKLNHLRSDVVRIGQKLVIQPGAKSAIRSSSSGRLVQYRVKGGDTLIGIAKRYRLSVAALKKANGLKSNMLRVGQTLKIPGKGSVSQKRSSKKESSKSSGKRVDSLHRVARGDTLSGIASKYKMSVTELRRINGLTNSNIRIGQKLRVRKYETTSKPVKQAPPAMKKSSSGKAQTYRVARGDTLFGIANKFGVSLSELRRRNNITGTNIKAGQLLKISSTGSEQSQIKNVSTVRYTVRRGDTLWSIARKHGVTVKDIERANKMKSRDLRYGMKIVIPK